MFDHHSVVYKFTNGARMYALCRTQKGCHSDCSTLLWGTKGRCNLFECSIEGETHWRFPGPKETNAYQTGQNRLLQAIRSNEPVNSGDYMVQGTRVAVMGQIACYNGQEVKLMDVEKSDFAFEPRDGNFDTKPPLQPGPDGNYPLPKPGVTKIKL